MNALFIQIDIARRASTINHLILLESKVKISKLKIKKIKLLLLRLNKKLITQTNWTVLNQSRTSPTHNLLRNCFILFQLLEAATLKMISFVIGLRTRILIIIG